MKRSRLVGFGFVLLTGCAGLISVPDLSFDESAPQGGADGSSPAEGGGGGEAGPVGDGGIPVPPCDTSKVDRDPNHCGACGHGCGGGECAAGKCQPLNLGTITSAPLTYIAVSNDYVFVSSSTTLVTQKGGIWRIPINGGEAELYSDLFNTERIIVVGDKVYFVVVEEAAGDAGEETFGGLYSCPVAGASPCTPKLIAAAETAYALTNDKGVIYYSDERTGNGIMRYDGNQPSVYRVDWGPRELFVDKEDIYFTFTYSGGDPYQVKLQHLFQTDAGDYDAVTADQFESHHASYGNVVGTPAAMFYTAYEYDTSTAGTVRRVSRTGGAGICEYGGTSNLRPYGLALDGTNVYWANQGDVADPFGNGSIATCPIAGCCSAAQVQKLWTGSGGPAGLTVDDRAIYWTVKQTGNVWKLAK